MFSQKDQLKFEIISKLVAGLINTKLASQILTVSYRTILRYKKGFLLKGSQFLIHGNTGHRPYNAIVPDMKDKIMNLITHKYYDFTVRHIWEKLKEDEQNIQLVSYKTLLNWCHEKNAQEGNASSDGWLVPQVVWK